jgi:hypothetical protein
MALFSFRKELLCILSASKKTQKRLRKCGKKQRKLNRSFIRLKREDLRLKSPKTMMKTRKWKNPISLQLTHINAIKICSKPTMYT